MDLMAECRHLLSGLSGPRHKLVSKITRFAILINGSKKSHMFFLASISQVGTSVEILYCEMREAANQGSGRV